ncbi:glycosyltransferase family 1 protein [Pseudobacteriovorax antillogorgiicola]|uniref:Uncharacterized protein n=1 Tax=Pseudobacteriovorax antillogorgiicola TaxID=1513793 RepID=A0A1Y6B4J2_9BACT|nr:glycosyltransferase family 1 protein [Pseudobacteriovorax antillogorgiicola]TCS59120.1 hypothetical protein EDD56_10123 [Pseudobacteriovorax antillogorgiicola]SME91557.1 hypothetical protein SAMN06296036_101463 [Pseudobacteriovorax antillogorgiicola]
MKNDKKTVWHICSNRWNSAVTEYALSAAKSLKDVGWNSVFTGLADKPGHLRAMNEGLSCSPLAHFKISTLPRLIKLYWQIRPDVIFVYGGAETFLSRFFLGTPIIRFRGQDRDLTHPPKPWSYRLSQSHIAGVITPSETVAKNFRSLETRTKAITLGIDAQRYQASETRYERPTVTILGRFDPVKGHGAFFLWFRMLLLSWPEDLPKPLLKVIGEPANIPIEHMRAFADDVKLVEGKDWELVAERVPQVGNILGASHLGVICSQGSEVICRVAEEFLLCGTPIFVSGVGSLEDCLFSESAGASYRDLPGDKAVALMKKLLIESFREGLDQKAARAREAHTHFSLPVMARQLEKLIAHVGPSHLRGLEPSAEPTRP